MTLRRLGNGPDLRSHHRFFELEVREIRRTISEPSSELCPDCSAAGIEILNEHRPVHSTSDCFCESKLIDFGQGKLPR